MAEETILVIGHATDPGLVRLENQDALDYRVPEEPDVRRQRGALLVVCDGIGGQHAGGKASQLAVSTFIRAYYDEPLDACDRLLRRAAEKVNAELFQANHGRSGPARMGTTLVAAVIQGPKLWVINVGDSRAYIARPGSRRGCALDQLSRDHVPNGRHGSDRRIELALGMESVVAPDVFGPVSLGAGDRLLLCTDGLTTAIAGSAIADTLDSYPVPQAARRLVEQAKTAGAQDNVSVLLAGLAVPTQDAGARPGRLGGSRALRHTLSPLRQWRSVRVSDLNPWPIIATGAYRSRRGILVLAFWAFLALFVGFLVGWLVPAGR